MTSLKPNYFPKDSSSNTITSVFRFHMNFAGTRSVYSNHLCIKKNTFMYGQIIYLLLTTIYWFLLAHKAFVTIRKSTPFWWQSI